VDLALPISFGGNLIRIPFSKIVCGQDHREAGRVCQTYMAVLHAESEYLVIGGGYMAHIHDFWG